jgi:hypothetical protein
MALNIARIRHDASASTSTVYHHDGERNSTTTGDERHTAATELEACRNAK